jgi:DNA-binding winged helix-turn-helix (wHTH) protein/Tfp pilus assembly protein PilF
MAFRQVSPGEIRFGIFEADLRSGELRRSGIKVRIQDLPFRALALLLSRHGEVVSREELRRALWPEDVFVDFDQAISSAIRRLREALGDSADNPVFIETVERRGYRWIAPVHLPAPTSVERSELTNIIPAASPPGSSPWRKSFLVLPVVVILLFAVWIFRPAYRNVTAGTRYRAVAPSNTLRRAANREAEDYYLKGRFYWNKRTPESLNQAVDSFTQAIVHDPGYSDAYVGLADCYNLLREYTLMPSTEAYPRALAAAKKAVELDDRSSAAHASLAFVSFFGMWDSGTADQEFRRAIELDPNNANAHHWYATYLQSVRRFEESLNEINRAQKLDPDSASILADKGMLLWRAGRRDEGLRLLRQLELADPNSLSPHRYLKFISIETGDDAGYLSELKQEALLLHDPPLEAIQEAAKKGFDAHGALGMLRGQADQQKKAYLQVKLSPYYLAETYAEMGNNEESLKYVKACIDRHSDETVNLAANPAFKTLDGAPAFQQFLVMAGLPPVK